MRRSSIGSMFVCGALVGAACLGDAGRARAEQATPPGRGAPAGGTWAGQLEALGAWLARPTHEADCERDCFVLRTLRLRGSLEERTLEFELEGGVLADGRVAVPLFGPPGQVYLEDVTVGTGSAQISFEGGSYFVFTDARQFVVRGTLRLQGDLALVIPGPLNTLEADLTGGRVVEGDRLSGLVEATIHFDRGEAEPEAAEPTVFQLARAIRVGREVTFEYLLTMRSGTDLGVVRLPLRFGERVLEVAGSTGWRVEDGEVVLPTAGRSAEIRLSGTLPRVGAFTPDERSSYEWWLLESDAEHRIRVAEGAARQVGSEESPIPRTQPTARLYMVRRGQRIEVSVESLSAAAVLAAVVADHQSMLVVTRNGDLIADETLRYENNGVDYLEYEPPGRPTYVATDSEAERVMLKREGSTDIMVPLRVGSHSVRVQSRAKSGLSWLGGVLRMPTGSHRLTTSHAQAVIGFPEGIYPIAAFGGDSPQVYRGIGDLAAIVIAVLLAFALTRGRGRRALCGLSLAGLWLVSPTVYGIVVVAAVAVWLILFARRLWIGPARVAATAAVCVVGAITAIIVSSVMAIRSDYSAVAGASAADVAEIAASDGRFVQYAVQPGAGGASFEAQNADAGVVQGVTPVAIPLPDYERAASVTRELIDPSRPFEPSVVYITSWALGPLVLAWACCLLGLGFSYRSEIRTLVGRMRAKAAEPKPPAAATAVASSAAGAGVLQQEATTAGPEPPAPSGERDDAGVDPSKGG